VRRARSRPSRISAPPPAGTEFLQRGLGIFADRNRLDVAGCDLAVAGEFGEIEAVFDCHLVDLGVLWCDQHDAVAEPIDPRRLVDVLLAGRIVHPVGVGGQENISRRALLDLFCERRACGIAGGDLDAGLCGEGGVDVVERVFHRSRGEHREALVLGRRGRQGRSAHDDKSGKNSGETMHGGAPYVFAGARQARANQALLESNATGGSAVPLLPATYGRPGYRSAKTIAGWVFW
jgi:hypothetical protein